MSEISASMFLCWIWLFSLGILPSNGVTWLTGDSPSNVVTTSDFGCFVGLKTSYGVSRGESSSISSVGLVWIPVVYLSISGADCIGL